MLAHLPPGLRLRTFGPPAPPGPARPAPGFGEAPDAVCGDGPGILVQVKNKSEKCFVKNCHSFGHKKSSTCHRAVFVSVAE